MFANIKKGNMKTQDPLIKKKSFDKIRINEFFEHIMLFNLQIISKKLSFYSEVNTKYIIARITKRFRPRFGKTLVLVNLGFKKQIYVIYNRITITQILGLIFKTTLLNLFLSFFRDSSLYVLYTLYP